MTSEVISAKRQLRGEMRERLRRVAAPEASLAGDHIVSRLGFLRDLKQVAAFAPLPGEPDLMRFLSALIGSGVDLYLPRVDGATNLSFHRVESFEALVAGPLGLREPAPDWEQLAEPHRLDAALVPGLAFGVAGERLGRGKGYYDRFLASLGPGSLTVGIAYDWQIVSHLPVEPHDVRVRCVATPSSLHGTPP